MRHFLAALLAIFSAPTLAETYCVDSSAEFLSAIASAQSSPGPSEIRVVQGVYDFTAPSATTAAIVTTDGTGLRIIGGYQAGCAIQVTPNPEQTLLRVSNTGHLMDMFFFASATGNVEIARIGMRQGTTSNSGQGGCLNIESDSGATLTVRLERMAFRLCNSTVGAGSALKALGRGMRLELFNSVFADNGSQSGAILLTASSSSVFYVTNNTVAFNPKPSALQGPAGLQLTNLAASGFFWVTNNVFYGNGSNANDTDVLYAPNVIGVVGSNIIGRSNPAPAGIAEINNSNANPLLASSVSLRPTANSPMRNSGNNSPAGGLPLLDFDGQNRRLGVRVDRGAFEFEEVFADGFE